MGPIKRKAQKAIEGKIKLAMFGKAKCRLCGDEVRLALKHLRDKHVERSGKQDEDVRRYEKVLC
jgi:hypothetical protein